MDWFGAGNKPLAETVIIRYTALYYNHSNMTFKNCHLSQNLSDIIIILGRLRDIYSVSGIISTEFCAILPQMIRVIWIFSLLWIFIILIIIHMKALKIDSEFTFNQHICKVYWSLELCSSWLRKKVYVNLLIMNFHRVQIQVMKYTFSQNDQIVKEHYFHHSGKKCLAGKIIRHNECHGISNHRWLNCLLNHLFKCRSKKTAKLRATPWRWPMDSPHKGSVTQKIFPFDDAIMILRLLTEYHMSPIISSC